MAQEMVSVQIGEKVYQYEKGITYREIALAHQQDYENDIVLVFVNRRIEKNIEDRLRDAICHNRGSD